jgi:hypothetical protein
MTFNFHDEVKDTITGFKGVVVSIFKYINGCVRIEVQPEKLGKDGKPAESFIFDSDQLALVKAAKRVAVAPSGGPRPNPPQRRDPRR